MKNILDVETRLQFLYEAYLRTGEYDIAAWYWGGLRTVQELISREGLSGECEGKQEHDYGMFDVCRRCGYYGGHQPGA